MTAFFAKGGVSLILAVIFCALGLVDAWQAATVWFAWAAVNLVIWAVFYIAGSVSR